MTAGAKFREVLARKGLVEAMAAHSPLSAMLVAEAGFDAIWASGFELSAMYGVPDVSVVSMTQHLDMTRAMVDRSGLPVVADIDTGFGNAINVLYVIEQYERAGVAAIVMEDKSFPKVTSLIAGGRQEMVRIEEFQGKIDAARAARKDKDLVLVARTEALIAGLGQDEALKRARAYEAAGADMILVHSKQKTPDEIEAFVKAWDGKAPIALVPTAYPQMTVARVRELRKIGLLIWGNHAVRASVGAMRKTFAQIRKDGGIHGVEGEHRHGRGRVRPAGHGQGQGRRKAIPAVKRRIGALAISLAVLATMAAPSFAQDLSGEWQFKRKAREGYHTGTLVIDKDGQVRQKGRSPLQDYVAMRSCRRGWRQGRDRVHVGQEQPAATASITSTAPCRAKALCSCFNIDGIGKEDDLFRIERIGRTPASPDGQMDDVCPARERPQV